MPIRTEENPNDTSLEALILQCVAARESAEASGLDVVSHLIDMALLEAPTALSRVSRRMSPE